MDRVLVRRAVQVVWAAFLTAAVAELVFFAIFDPFELHFFGKPLDWSRKAIYALGFLGFWGLGVASSVLTLMLTNTREPDISRFEE
jgi:hypothetical protein